MHLQSPWALPSVIISSILRSLLRLVSRNVDGLQNYIIDPRIDSWTVPHGTVVLCGVLCGSCFCDPKYQSSVSCLLLRLRDTRVRAVRNVLGNVYLSSLTKISGTKSVSNLILAVEVRCHKVQGMTEALHNPWQIYLLSCSRKAVNTAFW